MSEMELILALLSVALLLAVAAIHIQNIKHKTDTESIKTYHNDFESLQKEVDYWKDKYNNETHANLMGDIVRTAGQIGKARKQLSDGVAGPADTKNTLLNHQISALYAKSDAFAEDIDGIRKGFKRVHEKLGRLDDHIATIENKLNNPDFFRTGWEERDIANLRDAIKEHVKVFNDGSTLYSFHPPHFEHNDLHDFLYRVTPPAYDSRGAKPKDRTKGPHLQEVELPTPLNDMPCK